MKKRKMVIKIQVKCPKCNRIFGLSWKEMDDNKGGICVCGFNDFGPQDLT